MKKELVRTVLSALACLVITLFTTSLTGCATSTGSNGQLDQCARAQQLWDAYQVRLEVGPPPTEDEKRIAVAAHALLILYCGAPGIVAPTPEGAKNLAVGCISWPRQPKKLFVPNADGGKTWWYREHPFMIIQDPTGIFQPSRKGLETITTGPFYRKAWSRDLYIPDQAWLAGGPGFPTMIPIR